MLKKVERAFFYLLVFLLPIQLGYHFWPDFAFVFGVRVDYLAPTIYLTDVLLVILIALSRTKIKTIYLLGIFLLASVNTASSISPWVSLWKWVKVVEIVFFAKYIYDNQSLVWERTFTYALSMSLMIISVLGITQFLQGQTIGGIFYLMGERTFSISTPGIALQEIFGETYLRAYSSFSHPNSFAGYLLLGIMYLVFLKKKDLLVKLAVVVSVVSLLLTFSLSVFVAGGVVLALWFLRKQKKLYKKGLVGVILLIILASFIMPFVPYNSFNQLEIRERLEQASIAKDSILNNPIFGTGLNTFTLLNRSLQPVHNIFLLVMTEMGIVGFSVLLALLVGVLKKNFSLVVFAVLIIGFFDHYYLTLQQNMLSLALVFGTSIASKKKLQS